MHKQVPLSFFHPVIYTINANIILLYSLVVVATEVVNSKSKCSGDNCSGRNNIKYILPVW